MFKKKLLAMGLVITIALCGLSGCTSNSTTVPQETTPPEITSGEEETSTEEEETTTEEPTSEEETVGGVMGYVDVEDICKHISINGKVVEFPWTLNELGEEYTFSENTEVDLETKDGAAYLMYNDKETALLQAKIVTEMDKESLIYYLLFDVNDGIYIYDINDKSTAEDIIARFGLPTESYIDDPYQIYRYNTENIEMAFGVRNNTGTVYMMSIALTNNYLQGILEE